MEVIRCPPESMWIVFGDFNEIVHPNEKLGGVDRDAR